MYKLFYQNYKIRNKSRTLAFASIYFFYSKTKISNIFKIYQVLDIFLYTHKMKCYIYLKSRYIFKTQLYI